ncbi:MAG: translation elongation factor Ts [Actinobacteria bacterium]|nr:translation elongation factor Ts [Actinomycetota bacterium]
MEITAEMVKKLREKSGVGMMDCKKALMECSGDMAKASEYLREKGLDKAAKKASRPTKEGIIDSYIHLGSKIGVLLEINCETDFVARNEVFKSLSHNIVLHIAASSPLYLSREDIPEEVTEREKEIYRRQAINEGKPANVVDKIADGKISKFYQETCLLEQPYVKNNDITVKDLINENIALLGENIVVKRFVRWVLGETSTGE